MQAQGFVMVDLASDLFGHRGLPGSRSRKRGAPPGPVPGDTPTVVQRVSKNDARCNSLTGQPFPINAGRGPGLSRAKADRDCSAGDALGPSVGREGRGERGGPGRCRSSARPAPFVVKRTRVSAGRSPGRASPSLRNVRTAHGGDRHTPSPAPTRTFSRGGPPAARVPPARVAEPRTAVFSGGPG